MIQKSSWVDLPNEDYAHILGYHNTQIETLNTLVSAYHDLEKFDEDALPIRVERLEDVIEFFENWLNYNVTKFDKLKHLRILKEIAEQKRNYLLELIQISQIGSEVDEYLREYHIPKNINNSFNWDLVYLNPKRFYSVKKREHWGDFWWVTLDPCHRQLTNYLIVWEQINTNTSLRAIDFFLWLETQHVPVDFPKEKYLQEHELNASTIIVKNGLLYTQNENIAQFNENEKKYLYAIGSDNAFHVLEETNEIYHSSFYRGKPVYSSGKIKITDGIVTAVSFESGHYIPSIKVGYQLFDYLKRHGAIFAEFVEVSYFYERNKYTILVEKQGFNSFEDFKLKLESGINTSICTEEEVNLA